MNNPADRPQTFTTKADVIAEITQAIENGDARAEEYDLDAIAAECFTYDPAAGHIQHAGYHQTATVEEFWQSVERHAIDEDEDEGTDYDADGNPYPHMLTFTAEVESRQGDKATVSWRPKEVTGYDAARESFGHREWAWDDEENPPVFWKYDAAFNDYDLTARIEQFTGSTQQIHEAYKVDSLAELEPGAYYVHPAEEGEE